MLSNVFIVAGEASGDMHGAHLMNTLKQEHPNAFIHAMGGPQLATAGAHIIVDAKELAVVGFIEVISKLKFIKQAFKQLTNSIKKTKPELVILIDYPGFNLRLAKKIKQINANIRVVYYISPQIWAWRYHRIKTIRKYVDLMTVIFPFEVALYQKEKIAVKFVGNPIVPHVKPQLALKERRHRFNVKTNTPVIGLMPGSRINEIKHILPTMLEAVSLLTKRYPKIIFLLPLAPTLSKTILTPYVQDFPQIQIVDQFTYDAISLCDAVIATSGTVTLEIALLAKPMVIVYKTSFLTYWMARLLVNVKHIGLCNIVAEDRIVKEFIQHEVTGQSITDEVSMMVDDKDYRQKIITKLESLAELLQQRKAEPLSCLFSEVCHSSEGS